MSLQADCTSILQKEDAMSKLEEAKNNNFSENRLLQNLSWPEEPVDVVLDTDTYNEVDDQFALAYLLRSPERCTVKAVLAAPFFNSNSTSPEDGMEKSYDEIMRVLNVMDRPDMKSSVFRGSRTYLPNEKTPVPSEAADRLVTLSQQYSETHPLYVVAIACLTDLASAILTDPSIVRRIVVVWLGGHALHWPDTAEFNMAQDIAAARVVFSSGVPLVQLPCMGVVSAFAISHAEFESCLRGKNRLCDYLVDLTEQSQTANGAGDMWSRIIWDVTAAAWLMNPDFTRSYVIHRPIPEYDYQYGRNENGAFMRYVYALDRDGIWEDLVRKLS
jgi:inosine-uridine nucleoside N-ribohydrolase